MGRRARKGPAAKNQKDQSLLQAAPAVGSELPKASRSTAPDDQLKGEQPHVKVDFQSAQGRAVLAQMISSRESSTAPDGQLKGEQPHVKARASKEEAGLSQEEALDAQKALVEAAQLKAEARTALKTMITKKVALMEDEAGGGEEEEETAGDMDDPFAMMGGMGGEEFGKVTLMEEDQVSSPSGTQLPCEGTSSSTLADRSFIVRAEVSCQKKRQDAESASELAAVVGGAGKCAEDASGTIAACSQSSSQPMTNALLRVPAFGEGRAGTRLLALALAGLFCALAVRFTRQQVVQLVARLVKAKKRT